MKLGPYCTDAAKTIEELSGLNWGDPAEAPTGMVETIIRAAKKPIGTLTDEEIWLLVSQEAGLPFSLDRAWPILMDDPLHCFSHYEGDLLARLLTASSEIWAGRPEYRAALEGLKQRACAAPDTRNHMFRKVFVGQR